MYSASASSSTEPPVSWFALRIALTTFSWVMLKARSFCGSTTTWYWRTMPPRDATSATLGTDLSSYFRNQSWSARSCETSWVWLSSMSAYS